MGHKKAIILATFLACNMITNCQSWTEREFKNKIAPLLTKPQLTEEELLTLKKFRKDCEKEIAYQNGSIEYFKNAPISEEQKPLTQHISEAFTAVFRRPQWGYGDYSGIGNVIESQRVIIAYGFLPITAPLTLAVSVDHWWERKNARKNYIQNAKNIIGQCEEYIKKLNKIIPPPTCP